MKYQISAIAALGCLALSCTIVAAARPTTVSAPSTVSVASYGAVPDDDQDDTLAIQAAWDAAKLSGSRVFVPAGVYKISLQKPDGVNYGPALKLEAGPSKNKQPVLEGASSGAVFQIHFPAGASRLQEVILVSKYDDNQPLAMGLRNISLVNTNVPNPLPAWTQPHDFRGIGIKVTGAWVSDLLVNFKISGFYVGFQMHSGHHSVISDGEIRDCNFGIHLPLTPNGNLFRSILVHQIRPEARNDAETLFASTSTFPGGRVGACVYLGNGSLMGGLFEAVNTDKSSVAGYMVGSGSSGITVLGMRSTSVYAPVWARGPVPDWYSDNFAFINSYIECDSLEYPAFYMHRVKRFTIINPQFSKQRTDGGERRLIEMTVDSVGNYVLNPQNGGDFVKSDCNVARDTGGSSPQPTYNELVGPGVPAQWWP